MPSPAGPEGTVPAGARGGASRPVHTRPSHSPKSSAVATLGPMCTLIIGQDVIRPGSVILAGNRDEDPGRSSRGPAVLATDPRVVGGSDAVAGGTWMALRERRAAIAMLNRWRADGPEPPADGLRSRGRLTLDLAASAGHHHFTGASTLAAAYGLLPDAHYAPFNAVFASPSSSWVLSHRGEGTEPKVTPISRGWHVLTHRELDDPDEPRADYLRKILQRWRPQHVAEAREGLMELLASHEPPQVCIHTGRMVTVSSFVVWLAADEARYHHLDGRPCEHALEDFTPLLGGGFEDQETP